MIPRWLYLAALVAVLAFAGYQSITLDQERRQWAEERLETAKKSLRALEVAHAETIRLQGVADEAVRKANAREKQRRADATAAESELDGLRSDLAAARAALPSLSHQACLERADTLAVVFAQCGARLKEVAGHAQGHAIDAMKLDEAWPSSGQ